MNKIKTIMRLKIRALADGHTPVDADYVDVLEQESEDEDQEVARKLREQEERQERRRRRLEKRIRQARPAMTIVEEEEEEEEPEEEGEEEEGEEEEEGGGGGGGGGEEEEGGGEWGQELNLMSCVEGVIDPVLLNEGRPGVAPMAITLDGRVQGAMGELLRQEEESGSGGIALWGGRVEGCDMVEFWDEV